MRPFNAAAARMASPMAFGFKTGNEPGHAVSKRDTWVLGGSPYVYNAAVVKQHE